MLNTVGALGAAAVVPEPSSLALWGVAGLAALVARRRKPAAGAMAVR